jgi:hypothetical protein
VALVINATRAPVIAALVGAVAACTPDIGTNTYFCGPERLCPPDLECNDADVTCELPSLTEAFACPDQANNAEPDDDLASARDLGPLMCGVFDPLLDEPGCVPAVGDVDLYRFDYDDECTGGDPHIDVKVRFPIAHVPLTLELLDSEGAVLEVGELCTASNDQTGMDRVCLESRLENGTFFLRVRAADGGPDCDGTCHYNRYQIAFSLPLS